MLKTLTVVVCLGFISLVLFGVSLERELRSIENQIKISHRLISDEIRAFESRTNTLELDVEDLVETIEVFQIELTE